ncbi:MAG: helix-turn-helix domain-containing protein [Bacteroidales bacterium]|nr:helix-turn-helix domain-containing protein [Candidatus Equibacterium intestinale]
MEERLKLFLAMEGLSPAQLADRLGVQRSGISHLLQGRNKPSFEFINKMLAEFPKINPDWLIMGTGKAYRDGVSAPIPAVAGQVEEVSQADDDLPMDEPGGFDLFSANFADAPAPAPSSHTQVPASSANSAVPQQKSGVSPQYQAPAPQPVQQPRAAQAAGQEQIRPVSVPSYPSENRIKGQNEATTPRFSGQKQIRQIVIFFTDGTYEIR